MNKKTYNWYFILTILLSICGLVYFSFLLFDHLHIVAGTFLEGLAFPLGIFLFFPYEFLQVPLLIFNIMMFIIIYSKKVKRSILMLPGIFIVNHLVVIITEPMRTTFNMPHGILHAVTMMLLVLNLIIAINSLTKASSRSLRSLGHS